MTNIAAKVDHVRRAPQTRDHHCHWPGCTRQVPPALWGCKPHWYRLPKNLRHKIWRTYSIGQEIDGSPSADYIAAARQVQDWIARQPADPQQGDLLR